MQYGLVVNGMNYYTYAYLREDRTPYYIGKGTGNRIYSKHRRLKPPKDKSRIIFLKQNLTEEEAFKHEIYMIAVFGRKDLGTGILRNLTDGGEGTSNCGTPEQRSESVRKANASRTPEQRREISRKANAIKFQCTVTGFITNAGALSSYQRARGIDTSKRVRLDQ